MPLSVKHGDILDIVADAIVVPANPKPIVGNGLDKLVFHKAGRNRLLKARKEIGELPIGEACVTGSFDLSRHGIRYIIHAVSPAYDGGNTGECELLCLCYKESLKLALEKGCSSIAFPLLSTGILKYPKEEALKIATDTCNEFLIDHSIDISIIIYDGDDKSKQINEELDRYLRENDYSNFDVKAYKKAEAEWSRLPAEREERIVLELMRKQYNRKIADEKALRSFENRKRRAERTKNQWSFSAYETVFTTQKLSKDLESFISQDIVIPSFNETLEKFMKNKGIKSFAEISRKSQVYEGTISRMRSEDTNVKRDYLWAIAVALKLNIDETEELFNSCSQSLYGAYRLTDNDIRREFLIRFHIDRKIYDIYEINERLEERGFTLLGNMQYGCDKTQGRVV